MSKVSVAMCGQDNSQGNFIFLLVRYFWLRETRDFWWRWQRPCAVNKLGGKKVSYGRAFKEPVPRPASSCLLYTDVKIYIQDTLTLVAIYGCLGDGGCGSSGNRFW